MLGVYKADLAHAVGCFVSRSVKSVRSIGKLLKDISISARYGPIFGEAVACNQIAKVCGLAYNRADAIHLAKNSIFHKRTKHIDIRYHWIRDAIEDGMFELNKVHTDDNASDMLTKAVAREKLKICCSFAGMANSSS
ncbi:hypothetical protein Tco_0526365 [Tanacetum coccineum]